MIVDALGCHRPGRNGLVPHRVEVAAEHPVDVDREPGLLQDPAGLLGLQAHDVGHLHQRRALGDHGVTVSPLKGTLGRVLRDDNSLGDLLAELLGDVMALRPTLVNAASASARALPVQFARVTGCRPLLTTRATGASGQRGARCGVQKREDVYVSREQNDFICYGLSYFRGKSIVKW